MSEDLYTKVRDKQSSIKAKVCEEFAKFKKNNSEYRAKVAKKVLLFVQEQQKDFDVNNNCLVPHSATFAGRSYFAQDFYAHVQAIFNEFIALVKTYIKEDKNEEETDDDSAEDEAEINKEEGEKAPRKKMAGAEELAALVRQLADMQLQQQNQKPGDVVRTCANVIVKFDEKNPSNFLASVELALSFATDPNKLMVLKYAQQRVSGSALIENKSYESFDLFKSDVISVFKPRRTVMELESLIARLLQTEKESVDEFSKRVFQLKSEYESATRAERAADNAVLDEVRIREMEKKVAFAFINGLKDNVLRFVSQRPSTLAEAVSTSLEAESTSSLRLQNRLLEQSKLKNSESAQKRPFIAKTPSEEKAKSAKSNDKDKPKGPLICHHCNKEGHWRPNCPLLAGESSKEQVSASVSPNNNSKNEEPCGAGSRESTVSARSLKVKSQH